MPSTNCLNTSGSHSWHIKFARNSFKSIETSIESGQEAYEKAISLLENDVEDYRRRLEASELDIHKRLTETMIQSNKQMALERENFEMLRKDIMESNERLIDENKKLKSELEKKDLQYQELRAEHIILQKDHQKANHIIRNVMRVEQGLPVIHSKDLKDNTNSN